MLGVLFALIIVLLIIVLGATYVYAPDTLATLPGMAAIMPQPAPSAPTPAPVPTPLPPAPVSKAPEPKPVVPTPAVEPTPSAPSSAPAPAAPSTPAPAPVPAPSAPIPTAAPTPSAPAPTPLPPTPVSKAPEPTPVVIPPTHLSGCEADSAVLKCSSGVIKDGKFRYGRWNNSVCPHATINPNVAPKEKTYPITSCVGKSSCTLSSYNSTFNEDVYPNIYKQWEVDYTCQ